MTNQFNLKHLGFVNTNMVNDYENLNMLIKDINKLKLKIFKALLISLKFIVFYSIISGINE